VSEFAAFRSFELSERESPGFVPPYIEMMPPKQRAAYDDPSNNKVVLCPRRSGKSFAKAVAAYEKSSRRPDSESLILSTTRGHARMTVGNALDRLVRDYDLPLKERSLDGRFFYHNTQTNHRIWVAGCKDFREAEKLRGDRLDQVLIDECGAFTIIPDMTKDDGSGNGKQLLEYLVEDILSPRLMDSGGNMWLSGSPGVVLKGYWWEITTGDGKKPKWPAYHTWSVFENPFMKNVRAELEERKRIFGWDETSATYQREWLGRWVEDLDALIYRYEARKNHIDLGEWPGCIDRLNAQWGGSITWILGSDIGHNDATTFILTASKHGMPWRVFVRAWGGTEMLTLKVGAELMRVKRDLETRGQRLAHIVMDPGGGGKKTAEDMGGTFHIPVEAAEKQHKAAGVRMLQSALMAGHALVNAVECGPLLAEWSVLPWNAERTNHSDNYPDDFSDGGVYAFRRHPRHEAWDKVPPIPGSVEAINAEADAHKRLAARAAEIEYSSRSRSQQRRELERIGWRQRRRM
jgi:hypothetical protein